MSRGEVRIGTSGWMYKDWGKEFYPSGMREGFLTYLAGEFDTVEINNSFYHLPLMKTFSAWRAQTPEHFLFAVKLSRYITHRNLPSARQPLFRFLSHAKRLEHKLGPILVQLPPWKKFSEEWLGRFLTDVQAAAQRARISPRFALEPRHASWLENIETVRERLREVNIALAQHQTGFGAGLVFPHSAKIPSIPPDEANITADFAYVRFHGPSEFAASRYGEKRLKPWAERISKWQEKGVQIFCYFNNDVHGHAVHDARTLKQLVGISEPRARTLFQDG
ncbi:DUF72 domain-containing protein [Candidatus Kaiserbacteria bacterium]|nr:DUF72 domain-containing protein [Candidatus Kaiserbacteria bacterium]